MGKRFYKAEPNAWNRRRISDIDRPGTQPWNPHYGRYVVNHAGYDTDFGNMIRSGDDIVSGSDQKDSLSNLPDFKTEDPAVSAQLVKWQTQWVKDFGIDYFRVEQLNMWKMIPGQN